MFTLLLLSAALFADSAPSKAVSMDPFKVTCVKQTATYFPGVEYKYEGQTFLVAGQLASYLEGLTWCGRATALARAHGLKVMVDLSRPSYGPELDAQEQKSLTATPEHFSCDGEYFTYEGLPLIRCDSYYPQLLKVAEQTGSDVLVLFGKHGFGDLTLVPRKQP